MWTFVLYAWNEMFRSLMRHRKVLNLCLMVLLSACTPSLSTPTAVQNTPIGINHPAPTATRLADIYEQGIHLFDYDATTPIVITETSVRKENEYTVHEIQYPSPKTGNVPGYLIVPDAAGPFAGIVLMHGSSGSRDTLLPFAEELVLTGAVVLTISGPAARTSGRQWLTFTPQDREEQIQLMVDLRRGVDLLTRNEKVDPSRIGYVGYSYGAAMGGLLAGIERRIKAYGLMVGDGGLVNHFMDGDIPVGGFENVDPLSRARWLEAMEPIEPILFIGHASPSALFFQNARYDSSVSEEDALAYQAAGSESKQVKWYDSGHGLPSQAYVDMVHWLAEQIGIDATRFRQSS
jgi:poly(3-hydroxybutyrate) depolymerase